MCTSRRRALVRDASFTSLVFIAISASPISVGAAESASGVLLYEQVDATTFRYDIDLKNTGTTPIGTLWYSWVPGQDFMGSQPTNVSAPAGWSATVTHSGAGDGFAVEFVNSSGPLLPGQTLRGFTFDSSQMPAQLAGSSPFFPASQVGTTFIYAGGPLSDAGYEFEVDPSSFPRQNPFSRFDVDDNGIISAHDAVLIINALITGHVRALSTPTLTDPAPPFLDVRGDNVLSPADAVAVINHLITTHTTAQTAATEARAVAASFTSHAAPEPASIALWATGVITIVALRRRDCRPNAR